MLKGMGRHAGSAPHGQGDRLGRDQHASIQITLEDACLDAPRTAELRVPAQHAGGGSHLQTRTLAFAMPRGIRAGQHLRLAGQSLPGGGRSHANDLFLNVQVLPHLLYRMSAASPADIYKDLPVSPWQAALGAEVEAPAPRGNVHVKAPARSAAGRKLRRPRRGLCGTGAGKLAGDFHTL